MTESEREPEPLDLRSHDVGDAVSARIRRRAHVALARSARLAGRPWLARADRAWNQAVEPALVGAAALVYLAWAIARVMHFL